MKRFTMRVIGMCTQPRCPHMWCGARLGSDESKQPQTTAPVCQTHCMANTLCARVWGPGQAAVRFELCFSNILHYLTLHTGFRLLDIIPSKVMEAERICRPGPLHKSQSSYKSTDNKCLIMGDSISIGYVYEYFFVLNETDWILKLYLKNSLEGKGKVLCFHVLRLSMCFAVLCFVHLLYNLYKQSSSFVRKFRSFCWSIFLTILLSAPDRKSVV